MEPDSAEMMTPYLAATRLCDYDNAKVAKKSEELAGAARDPAEAALRIFYFVRDKISFGLDYPDARASETLDRGIGFCMTKTNLQMALLRAAGIPSRCHLVHLPKEVNKAITPRLFYDRMADVIVHPWCECYLDGRWIACDSVLDDAFYRGGIERGLWTKEEVPSIDWDGKTDHIFGEPQIQRDLGTFPSWDEGIEAARTTPGMLPTNRLLGPLLFLFFNRRIRKIRMS